MSDIKLLEMSKESLIRHKDHFTSTMYISWRRYPYLHEPSREDLNGYFKLISESHQIESFEVFDHESKFLGYVFIGNLSFYVGIHPEIAELLKSNSKDELLESSYFMEEILVEDHDRSLVFKNLLETMKSVLKSRGIRNLSYVTYNGDNKHPLCPNTYLPDQDILNQLGFKIIGQGFPMEWTTYTTDRVKERMKHQCDLCYLEL